MTNPIERLKHHVTGAIERGESVAIIGKPALMPHPFMNPESMPIVDSIIKTALANGLTISVHDGEEWSLKRCSDSYLIWHALAQTESGDTLKLRRNGESIGTVYLIYENGVDVIADHSESDMMTRILAPAFNLANGL